ncbi:DUF1189 family protein [Aerococcaceae bacterium DSM 111020]|nr:DUF1189 family protein [Aerococcaceae bacterium DSM 111020]
MKSVLNIITKSIKEPRFALQSVSLNRRQIGLVILVMNVLLTLTAMFHVAPMAQDLATDVAGASTHLPAFSQTLDGQLEIADGDKPLYYQSDSFQLVLDDTLEKQEDGTIPIQPEQRDQISQDTFLSLFLFKNVAYVGSGDNLTEIPLAVDFFTTPNNLSQLLNFYVNHPLRILIPIFFSLFFASLISYLLEMALLTLFSGAFVLNMMQLPFGSRFKLVVIASVLPIILIELIGFFLAMPFSSYLWIMLLTFLNIQRMFIDQSRFLNKLFENSQFSNREEFIQRFREELRKLEREKKEEEKKNQENDYDQHHDNNEHNHDDDHTDSK